MSDGATPSDASSAPAASDAKTDTSATSAPQKGATSPTPVPKTAEYEFDFEGQPRKYTAEELRANFLKGKSAAQLLTKAEQRAREVAEKEKRFEESRTKLKTKGERLRLMREQYGYTDAELQDLAEEILLPQIQRETLTADQRAIYEAQQRADEAERRLHAKEEAERDAQQERMAKEHQERLGASFVAALDKLGLPQASAPWAIKRMAALAEKADDLGLDLGPDEIAGLVKEDFVSEHKSLTKGMTGAQAEAFYGKEFVDMLVRHRVQEMKAQRGQVGQKPAPGVAQTPRPNGHQPKIMNEREFEEHIKRLVKES